MNLTINRESSTPLYMQICEQIKENIILGIYPKGYQLLPERKLADMLQVNRSTVLNAYRELKATGLVDSQVGKGTIVLGEIVEQESIVREQIAPLSWYTLFQHNIQKNNDAIILDLMEMINKKETISFAAGKVDENYYPTKDMMRITQKVMEKEGSKIFEHTPIEGHIGLRKEIQILQDTIGINSKVNEIMVLAGSQQGLDLIGRVFLESGDVVIVEEPTYLGALQVFKSYNARIISIPVDKQGMKMDILEATLRRYKPKFIYTMPTFHNPLGIVMSLERRKKIMELAYQYQIPIIEDDAYGFLRYEHEELPTLKALDCHGYVIYLNTFSKVLFPGLRLGWVSGPREVIKQFALVKQNMDIHANSISQWIVKEYLHQGLLDNHLTLVKGIYQERRDAMIEALEENYIEGFDYNKPEGGFYIWCKLPEHIDAAKLLMRVSKKGVVFVHGEVFYTGFHGKEYLRLNFTNTEKEKIRIGIKIITDTIKELLQEKKDENSRDSECLTSIY